jgi:hypothetical protein
VNHEIDDISKGENMIWSKSHKEERLKKKKADQEFEEEMVRRLYIGPDVGG